MDKNKSFDMKAVTPPALLETQREKSRKDAENEEREKTSLHLQAIIAKTLKESSQKDDQRHKIDRIIALSTLAAALAALFVALMK